MSKYWIASGEIGEQIKSMLDKRLHVRKKMVEFGKRFGADKVGVSDSIGAEFALYFDGAIPGGWKKVRGNECYKPKLSTKEGKAIAAEMKAIESEYPDGVAVGNLVGLEFFKGMRMRTPGVGFFEKKIVLVMPDDYKPPKKIAGNMKRISDVEFETMQGRKSK